MSREIVRTIVEDDKSLVLRRNKSALELVLGNVVLLSSAALETEYAFGQLARESACRRVVIGGLGFGATLRGVLAIDPAAPEREVIVVEKLRTVIDVAKNEAADLVAGALDDPRVDLRCADVADVIAEMPSESVDAILLDVDNGPEWASFRSNARLYSDAAVAQMRTKLAPNGVFAVWSGYPADAFLRVLRKAGFTPRVVPLHENKVVRARAYVGTLSTK